MGRPCCPGFGVCWGSCGRGGQRRAGFRFVARHRYVIVVGCRRRRARHVASAPPAEIEGVMLAPEHVVAAEWAEWYRLPPAERWVESQRLWADYLRLGGSLDPEPDTQSPFYDASAPRPVPPDGRAGVRVVRRGGV